MEKSAISKKVIKLVNNKFGQPLHNDLCKETPLRDQYKLYIDDIVGLAQDIEKEFDIKLLPEDITAIGFSSVESLVDFIDDFLKPFDN